MPTYLYCLLKPAADPRGVRGVAGEIVRSLTIGDVAAWVGDVASAPRATVDTAEAHDTVLSAALAGADAVVPARFGQVMADDETCRHRLDGRMDELRDSLDKVAGLVEMAFVAQLASADDMPSPPPHTSGRAYLEGLREQIRREDRWRDRAERLRAVVREQAGDIVRDERLVVRAPTRVVTVSHLVPRAEVDEYRQRLGGLRFEGALETLIVGPAAPGSFVTMSA